MFEQRSEGDWRSIDDRYDKAQAWRELDELLARRSQLKRRQTRAGTARQPVPELRKPLLKRSQENRPSLPKEEEMERFFAGIESPRDHAIFRII